MSSSLCPQCQGINILSITNGCLLHPDWHSLELAVSDYNCIFCRMILQSLTQYLCIVLPQIVIDSSRLGEVVDSEGRLLALPEMWYNGLETPVYMYPVQARVTEQPAGAYEAEGSFIHDYVEVNLAARRCEGRPIQNMVVISCGTEGRDRAHGTFSEWLFADRNDPLKSRTSYYKSSTKASFYLFRVFQEFRFRIGPDDILLTYLDVPGNTTLASDSTDQQLLSKIKRWRDECTQEHLECQKRTTTHDTLPGRLVDVGTAHSSGRLHIIHTDDNFKEEYVALSYCWGPGLKQWIEQWVGIVRGIQQTNSHYELDSLPATLRDAVEVTLSLGYRYLWIDCLCILQGDAEDWANESEKMGYIYENADLIISATATPDCRQSFLRDRTHRRGEGVRLPIACEPGVVGTLIFGEQPGRQSIDDQPVSSRAWCMQERVLARRVLHWFPDEIIFECVRCRRRESEATRCFHFDSPAKRRNNWYATGDGCGKPTLETTGDFSPNLWSKLVQDFCARNLTFQSDKLVAIAGMARRMNELSNDRYLAGHWLGWLVEDLMWYADDAKAPGKRAAIWRAPSWSWASMDTPVQPFTTNEDSEYEVNPTIVEASTTTAVGRPFGQVNSAKIVLRGQMRAVPVKLLTTLPRDESTALPILQGKSPYRGWYVEDEASSLTQEFLCLRMLTEKEAVDPSLRRRVEVLLLKRDGSNTFTRLGMASIFDVAFFEGVEEQEIVLL